MNPRILVTGATGNVGGEVVKSLLQADVPCRIGVRNPNRIDNRFDSRVQVVAFNFLEPATYEATFAGIESIFLVRPPQLANVERDIAPALEHAVRQGIRHIIFLSLQGVENSRITPHHKIEQLIGRLGVDYTFLRAGFFMQNLSTTHRDEIRDDQRIGVPVGNAKTSFIDVRDIGAVGAQTLIDAEHKNKAYTLTGSESLTYYDVAQILSDVLGKDIRYTNPNPLRYFWEQWRKEGNFGYAFVVTALYTATRFGNANAISHDTQRILNREPITLRQFVRDYRNCWLPDTPQATDIQAR